MGVVKRFGVGGEARVSAVPRPSQKEQLIRGIALGAVLTLSACASATTTSPAGSPPSLLPSPSQSSEESPISLVEGCSEAVSWCQDIPAGTYVISEGYGPLPGLVVTIPADWSSSEQDRGEFNLYPVDGNPDNDILMFWRDVVAADQTGQPAAGIGTTPADLAEFLATDPRLVVSDRDTTTIGNGIPAVTLVMRVSTTGPNDDPEYCPGDICANVLTAAIWGHTYGIALNAFEDPTLTCPCSHAVRLYLVSIGPASDPGTFVVAVQVFAPDPDSDLAAFQEDVQPIIDSIRLAAETEVLQP